jgi:hypothetical protein
VSSLLDVVLIADCLRNTFEAHGQGILSETGLNEKIGIQQIGIQQIGSKLWTIEEMLAAGASS